MTSSDSEVVDNKCKGSIESEDNNILLPLLSH